MDLMEEKWPGAAPVAEAVPATAPASAVPALAAPSEAAVSFNTAPAPSHPSEGPAVPDAAAPAPAAAPVDQGFGLESDDVAHVEADVYVAVEEEADVEDAGLGDGYDCTSDLAEQLGSAIAAMEEAEEKAELACMLEPDSAAATPAPVHVEVLVPAERMQEPADEGLAPVEIPSSMPLEASEPAESLHADGGLGPVEIPSRMPLQASEPPNNLHADVGLELPSNIPPPKPVAKTADFDVSAKLKRLAELRSLVSVKCSL